MNSRRDLPHAVSAAGLVVLSFLFFLQQAGLAALPASKSSPGSSSAIVPSQSFGDHPHQHHDKLTAAITERVARVVTRPEFKEFNEWIIRYSKARGVQRRAIRAQGIVLSKRRKAALEEMIRTDPESALRLAIPDDVRRSLPPQVTRHLETRVSGRGSLIVREVCPKPDLAVAQDLHGVTVNGKQYRAFIYGRRVGQPSRENVRLHGVAVGDLLALSEDTVRVLEPYEADEVRKGIAERVCLVCNCATGSLDRETVVDVGGQAAVLCSREHAAMLNAQLVADEDNTPMGVPIDAGGGIRAAQGSGGSWTLGQKKVILIRVDFSDLTGESFSVNVGNSIIDTVNTVYTEMSHGKTGFALGGAGSEVTSSTFRMPQTASWYGTFDFNGNTLRMNARTAAQAAGYNLANYDLDVICFKPVAGWSSWTGQANVGAAGAWVQGSSSPLVFVHELGHNFGLNHANFWDTAGASVIGPGTRVEYGDIFDIMGFGFQSDARYHFNARYKSYLNWLSESEVTTVVTNGIYRVFAHDTASGVDVRGLKIPRNALTNYWVEFRQSLTSNKSLMNGAGLRWAQNGNQRSLLLDTTPGTSAGRNDSALVIGRTFSDFEAGIHITPISKGNTSPESLDVVVNLGSPVTNLPPSVVVSAAVTNIGANSSVSCQCVASDANGDALVYDWDFGDGDFGTNGPVASHAWGSVGEYVVRCRVSDMKGGSASDSVLIVVGSPSTFRITGRVTEAGEAVENVRISVSSTRITYTDSDGNYILAGLPAGSYTISASQFGYSLSPIGFSNPLNVGANLVSVDFAAVASTVKPPLIAADPQGLSLSAGSDAVFSATAFGTPPLKYQWRFNGVDIAGATTNRYVRAGVQIGDAGGYSIVVTNAAGSVTSSVATLTVQGSLAITEQPQSQLVTISSNVTFAVTATGSPPLAFQWFFNGTTLMVGATNSVVTITSVQDGDGGFYSVVVSNGASVTSSNALLTVNHPPSPASPVLERYAFTGTKARINDFLGTDPDGDVVSLFSVGPGSAQGGTVVTNSGWVIYTPPPGFTNIDSFPFAVSDGRGGISQGTANVVVTFDNVIPQDFRAEILGAGSVRLIFDGIQNRTYSIEYTENLDAPVWQSLTTVTADEHGVFVYVDSIPIGAPQRFYRAAWP